MAQKYRNVGGIEASDALTSVTDGDGAYMDFDTAAGNARFGAKGGAGSNRGVLIRTLLAGAVVAALTFTAAGAATFIGAVSGAAASFTTGAFSSTVNVVSNLSVNTNKFVVTGTTGAVAGGAASFATLGASNTTALVGTFNSTNAAGPHIQLLKSGTIVGYIGQDLIGGTGSAFFDLYMNTGNGIRLVTNNIARLTVADTTGLVTCSGAVVISGTILQNGGAFPAAEHTSANNLRMGLVGNIITFPNASIGSAGMYLSNNAYFRASTGLWAYLTTAAASEIRLMATGINFLTAASGTAGDTITFNERMTIATATGAVTISNLAGTGDRHVMVDANGVLSAP